MMPSTRANELLQSPIGLELLNLLSENDVRELTGEAAEAMVPVVRRRHSRFNSDYEERVRTLQERSANFAGMAERLASLMR